MSKEEAKKNFWTTLVVSVLVIIFGIFLLFKPHSTIAVISRCITAITALIGLFGLYKYLTRQDKTKKLNFNIIYSVVAFVVAGIIFLYPTSIVGVLPIVVGGFIIVNTLFKYGYLKHLRKSENRDFGVCLLIFIIMIIDGIILVINPLKNVLEMSQSLGMLLTFYAVLDMIMCYLFKNNIE